MTNIDPTAPPVHGEILTGVQRRHRRSTAEKVRLVKASEQPASSVSFVARRYGLASSLVFSWKQRMLEGGHQAVQANEDVVGNGRVHDLEGLFKCNTIRIEILREVLNLARAKSQPHRSPVRAD